MTDSPGGVYTSRVYKSPLVFRTDHPEYAAAAREFIRSRPDVRSLRFVAATVGRWANHNGGGIAHITIELESPDRMLWVDVSPQPFGRWCVESVIDRERFPWERCSAR